MPQLNKRVLKTGGMLLNLFFTGMLRRKIACPMGKDITVKAGLLVGREVGPQGSVIRFCTEFL